MGNRIEVEPDALILAAAGLLLLPFEWFISAVCAAAVHELGHLIVIKSFRLPCVHLRIGASGAAIETGMMSSVQEFFSAAAGPAFSFLLLLFRYLFPKLAIAGLIQGAFNLIPIYPMDGGRLLHTVLSRFFPNDAESLTKIIGFLVAFVLACLLIGLKMTGWVVMGCLVSVTRFLSEKFLAKMSKKDYNGSD